MPSMTDPHDDRDTDLKAHGTHDEFAELEALSAHHTWWKPRDPEKNHPPKLVLKHERWETATSQFNDRERDVAVGSDRDGQLWKVACDNLDLQPLRTGDIKEWNDDRKQFEVVGNYGPLREGEVFAVEYRGDRTYTNKDGKKVTTGSYRFTRKPPASGASDGVQGATYDEIPF